MVTFRVSPFSYSWYNDTLFFQISFYSKIPLKKVINDAFLTPDYWAGPARPEMVKGWFTSEFCGFSPTEQPLWPHAWQICVFPCVSVTPQAQLQNETIPKSIKQLERHFLNFNVQFSQFQEKLKMWLKKNKSENIGPKSKK